MSKQKSTLISKRTPDIFQINQLAKTIKWKFLKYGHDKVQKQPVKQRIPNVSLDPIESQSIQKQKLMGLQDLNFLEPSFQGGEQRRSKNIQILPIYKIQRSLGNSYTVMNLNQLNNINMNSIDFDQIANKTPNRVKLDKIKVLT
ncbi:hypothetical protein ABPG72_022579 [Tetrahymena utriculariae]